MKKTLVRIVALVLLAVMILSVIPAFAAGIVGNITSQTNVYQKKSTSSSVIASVQGTVNILGKDADVPTMYQITFTQNGKTYTGWVPAASVTNIRSDSGSVSTGNQIQYGNTTSSGIYSAKLNSATNIYSDNNKLVGTAQGTVTVNYRNVDSSQVNITASGTGGTVTGWVAANALSGLYSRRSGSIKVSELPTNGTGSTATGAYTAYTAAKVGISTDSTIYIRPSATSSTSGATKISNAKGLSFSLLGESGNYYFASYNGSSGFVRKQDFTVASGTTTGSNGTTTPTITGAVKPATTYSRAQTAVSTDSTIYMRYNPDKSTAKENVVVKVTSARGVEFSLLGETGDWYYARYTKSGIVYEGFVRKQDFTITSGTTVGTTNGTTNGTAINGAVKPATTYSKAQAATSNDSTIYMRHNPDKSTAKENVVIKITSARGVQFSLLGETGDWYYARYTQGGSNYEGFVRKQDFTIVSAGTTGQPIQGAVSGSSSSSGATTLGTGASSEKWGSFTVPGGSTYPIYGNYYKPMGGVNQYYYSYEASKNYNYLHTTTAKGSQVHVIMGHNMRNSTSYFHKLHHVQNALIGKSSCEGCGGSCGSTYKTTTFSASLDGYNTWDIVCFYEIPSGASTSILNYNAQPWNTSTSSYLSTQLQYAKQSGLKGWVNPSVSATNNGKYMMLITCGDKYESGSNATSKLYMLLKARG